MTSMTDQQTIQSHVDVARTYAELAVKFLSGDSPNLLGATGNLAEALKYVDFAARGVGTTAKVTHPTMRYHVGSKTHGGPEQYRDGCREHGLDCAMWKLLNA